MVTPSPREYSFVRVERSILPEYGEPFLSKVREAGRMVLGEEFVSSLSEVTLSDPDEDGLPTHLVHRQVPTAAPRMAVTDPNSFSMMLLEKSVPPESASRYSCSYVMGRLAAESLKTHETFQAEDGSLRRGKVVRAGLPERLEGISRKHGLAPEHTIVTCDRIAVIVEPGKDYILGLSPRSGDIAERALQDQAKEVLADLPRSSRRLTYPLSPGVITAVFGRVPGNVTDSEYAHLMQKLNAIPPVRVGLGGVEFSSKDRRRQRQWP